MPETIGSPAMWIAFGAFVAVATLIDPARLRTWGGRPVLMRQAFAWPAIRLAAPVAASPAPKPAAPARTDS